MTNTKWTAEQLPDQSGKVMIVTGANSGLGYGFTLEMARRNAHVVMACRSIEKAQQAADEIRQQVPHAALHIMTLDLASQASVRQFAEDFKAQYGQLDILCNNAGVMHLPYRKTVDGFEMQFATNHLGHFALTGLLLDLLLATPHARVVNVSSTLHTMGKIEFDNLHGERGYNRYVVYGNSKLANLLFTYELQRRFEKASITSVMSVAAHPGYTATNLQYGAAHMEKSLARRLIARMMNTVLGGDLASGILPLLYAAAAPGVNGCDYIGRDGFMKMYGSPVKERSNELSYDTALAERLWVVSEDLTGVRYHIGQIATA